MQALLKNVSLRLTRAGNRINFTFGGRHHKTILHHPSYYLNAYKYNYRNPVEAGICVRVEDYPYSSLRGLLGQSPLLIPMVEDTTLISDPVGTLAWVKSGTHTRKA